MKSKDYWKKRSEDVASKQFKKTDDYISKLHLEYQEALYSIRKDIESFYQRFASNNQVTLDEARRLLNSNELSEFKMDLKEFRNKAKNNIDDIWEQELNNVSYKVRISRLQALQTQINNEIRLLYSKQQEGVTSLLNDIYEDTYYRNIYEVHKGLGIGVNFAKLDTRTVEKVMSEQWQGNNYSSRIWNDKEKLIRELRVNLTQSFIRGDPIDKTSRIITERMNVSKNRAITLVNTESAYITSKATFDSYSKSGVVKQYEILVTLDLRTSKICRSMDGKVFKVSEKEIGVNAPPFHPNCRTTTVAYFSDNIDEERIARNSEGKNYYVDGDMSYKDWYNKYVRDNPKEEIVEKKIKNKSNDIRQHERYKEILEKDIPKSFDKFQELKYNNINEWNTIKDYYKSRVKGDISAFSTLGDYKWCKNKIENNLMGITTPNGIKIKSYSKHFIDRVLGTSNDPKTNAPRDGVEVEDIKNALEKPLKIKEERKKGSHKVIGEKVTVSINPDTGNLIQCNPTDSDLVRRLKCV